MVRPLKTQINNEAIVAQIEKLKKFLSELIVELIGKRQKKYPKIYIFTKLQLIRKDTLRIVRRLRAAGFNTYAEDIAEDFENIYEATKCEGTLTEFISPIEVKNYAEQWIDTLNDTKTAINIKPSDLTTLTVGDTETLKKPKLLSQKAAATGKPKKKRKPLTKNNFTFGNGQALFRGEDLKLPAKAVDILKKLVDSLGTSVTYTEIGTEYCNGNTASDFLRGHISRINALFKTKKIPYKIRTIRGIGCVLEQI